MASERHALPYTARDVAVEATKETRQREPDVAKAPKVGTVSLDDLPELAQLLLSNRDYSLRVTGSEPSSV